MSSCTLVRMTRSKMTQVIEIFGDTGKVRTCGQQRGGKEFQCHSDKRALIGVFKPKQQIGAVRMNGGASQLREHAAPQQQAKAGIRNR